MTKKHKCGTLDLLLEKYTSLAYQVYRAGTKKLYPTDQLPILRSHQPTTFSRINST